MPQSITGYTRDEMIDELRDTVGNTSTAFQLMLERMITAWQYQFCGLHDWSFLKKNGQADNVDFVLVQGTYAYTLNTATIGYEMDNANVSALYLVNGKGNNTESRRLNKVDEGKIRLGLSGETEDRGKPLFWAPYGRQGVLLYPVPDATLETVSVDGKIHGSELHAEAELAVPYKYQDLFFQFCLSKALRRERDPRASEELQIFEGLLRRAIAEDSVNLEDNTSWQSVNEALQGYPTNLTIEQTLWNSGD